MNTEQLRNASKLWRSGESGKAIAKAVGIKVSHLFDVAGRYRHMFPTRTRAVGERTVFVMPPVADYVDDLPSDHMRWITESGAIVTLPRISLIECPRVRA